MISSLPNCAKVTETLANNAPFLYKISSGNTNVDVTCNHEDAFAIENVIK